MNQSLGKLILYLMGDATSYLATLRKAQSEANVFSRRMLWVGMSLTTGVAIPLTQIGANAARMSMAFAREMAKIEGLVGISRTQVKAWEADVKNLSVTFGRAPQELAKSLFFITSAQLKGSEALDALKISAKGAAAGMGEASEIAMALVSSINAYRQSGMTAAKAGDILAATVRKGNIEIDSLARIIGRILPISSSMKVPLEDVGASIAALTLTGSTASEAMVGIQGILKTFAKPAKQAVDAMAAVGLNFQQMRDLVQKPGGLLEAIRLIDKAMEKEGQTGEIAAIFGDVRPLKASMNLLAQSPEIIKDVFDSVRNASDGVGVLTEAFNAAAATPGFKFDQLMAQIKVTLIDIGDIIAKNVIPTVQSLTQFIRDVTEGFNTFTSTREVVKLFSTIRDKANEAWQEIQKVSTETWQAIMDTLGTDWNSIQSNFKDTLNVLRATLKAINMGKITESIKNFLKYMRELVSVIGSFIAANAKLIGTITLITLGLYVLYEAIQITMAGVSIFSAAASGIYSIAVGIATAATWAWNAALVVLDILLSPVAFAVAVVAIAGVVQVLVLAAAAAWGVWKAAGAIVDVFLSFPKMTGLINHMTGLFEEWGAIIKDVQTAAKDDLPKAWEIMQKGFELAVSEMADLWPPMWKFIHEGFSALWGLVKIEFKLAMIQALMEFAEATILSLGGLFGPQFIDPFKKQINAMKTTVSQGMGGAVDAAIAKFEKASHAFDKINPSEKTKKLREELQKLRDTVVEGTPGQEGFFGKLIETVEGIAGGLVNKAREYGTKTAQSYTQALKQEINSVEATLFNSAESAFKIRQYAALLKGENVKNTSSVKAHKSPSSDKVTLPLFNAAQGVQVGFKTGEQRQEELLQELVNLTKQRNASNNNKPYEVLPLDIA